MKPYTVSIEIDAPRERVVAMFDDVKLLSHWQTGLESVELLDGVAGQVGARSKLTFINGKQRIELFETVTARDLPDSCAGEYEWSTGRNTLENRFIELGPNRTRYESTCSYEFSSLMLKFMGFAVPGMFRKQNQKFLDNFKEMVESST